MEVRHDRRGGRMRKKTMDEVRAAADLSHRILKLCIEGDPETALKESHMDTSRANHVNAALAMAHFNFLVQTRLSLRMLPEGERPPDTLLDGAEGFMKKVRAAFELIDEELGEGGEGGGLVFGKVLKKLKKKLDFVDDD